jgi:hypothetical protein
MAPFLRLFSVLLTCCVATGSCSQSGSTNNIPAADVFVGSTPCDNLIQSMLKLPAGTKCEFIRWELALMKRGDEANTFALGIVYGEGQPNTSGFKGGGEKRFLMGAYTAFPSKSGRLSGEVLQLTAKDSSTSISLIKLNDNLYHLLAPDHTLMVGNGGWSYTLSRKETLEPVAASLPSLTPSASLLNDTARQVTFEGRTPCQEFAKEYDLKVSNDCFKLKWKLVLHRDAATYRPATFILYSTLSRERPYEGRWTMTRGYGNNPDAVIYRLDLREPHGSLAFLVGDRNVVFLLDKKGQLLKGDHNFSYTLNRKP